MKELKQLNKELQAIQEELETNMKYGLSEKLQNIIDDISNLVEPLVMPKIADFVKFFKQEEKELIDAVGENSWMNEKVYFPTEIMDFVNKWIDSNFTA